jgi:hypothetical protein
MAAWKGIIHAYGDRMNISKSVPRVTLCKGNMLLILLPRLAAQIAAGAEFIAKFKKLNSVGSFKYHRDHSVRG